MSELDVGIDDTSEENLQKQAKYYGDLMKIFLRYADRIEAVQVWGTVDDLSWRADEYPLLFDKDAQPKPAFDTLVELSKSIIKATLHNSAARRAMSFPPSVACKFLDLLPVNLTKNPFASRPPHLCGVTLTLRRRRR